MKIVLIAVGQKIPAWAQTACDDYLKRFPSDWRVELKTVKTQERSSNKNIESLVSLEAQKIRSVIYKPGANPYLVLFDEHGKGLSTLQLASALERIQVACQELALVIGGPDGIDTSLKKAAKEIWSLSMLTLPHALARVVAIEQLYRAWSVLAHHPYHRE